MKEKSIKTFNHGRSWDDEMMRAYLLPFWETEEIYNESVVFVGEESEATLMFEPEQIFSVTNYLLDREYEEGVDYTISGRTIKRLSGGSMPFWNVDEYYTKQPIQYDIKVDRSKADFSFGEERYLYYGEGPAVTKNHIFFSYRHKEKWKGSIPKSCSDKFKTVLDKLRHDKKATIMFYGDSITTGANASGTPAGGMVPPNMPPFDKIIKQYLEKKFDCLIDLMNEAVGGWATVHGLNSFDEKILSKGKIDLFILAFGMNDTSTPRENYRRDIEEMTTRFLKANPEGCVMLVSTMMPNTQSLWLGNQLYFEEDLYTVASKYPQVAVAPVGTMFKDIERTGKKTRDWLANNINHPNDFGVRVYAQVILKTLLGDEFD